MPHGHCCDFRRDSSPENPFEFICLYPARRDHAVKCSFPRVLLHAMISMPVYAVSKPMSILNMPLAAAVVFARLSKSVVVYGSGMN